MKRILSVVLVIVMSISMPMSVMAGSWQQNSSGWWYQTDDGGYYSGGWWQDVDGQWYYFNGDGYILQNQWCGNYYLGANGAMLTNSITPDGYQVGPDGAWIQNNTQQTQQTQQTTQQSQQSYSSSQKSSSGGSSVTVPKEDTSGSNLVWVPTNGGTKYHSRSTCSKMKNPVQVPQSTAENNGYSPCKKCF